MTTPEQLAAALRSTLAYIGTLPKPRDRNSRHTRIIETSHGHKALARYNAEKAEPVAEACECVNADDPAPYRVDLRVNETQDRVIAWCDSAEDAERIAAALNGA